MINENRTPLGDAGNRATKAAALTASIALSTLFLVVYSGTNWITSLRSDVGTWHFDWERWIPFVPWMVIPYPDLFTTRNLRRLLPCNGSLVIAGLGVGAPPLTPCCLIVFSTGLVDPPSGGHGHWRRTSNEKACAGGGIQSRRRDPCGFGKRSGNCQRLMHAIRTFQNGVTACAT